MQDRDIIYLNLVIASFVGAMTQRMAFSGDTPMTGQISSFEIKQGTGRDRLAPSILESYLHFLQASGIEAYYEPATSSIMILINSVFNIRLSPQQAALAAQALHEYRLRSQM